MYFKRYVNCIIAFLLIMPIYPAFAQDVEPPATDENPAAESVIPDCPLARPPKFARKYSFEYRKDKKFKIKIPKVELTEEEKAKLFSKDNIQDAILTKLIEGEDDLKKGWMMMQVENDPVTVWMIITNIYNFHSEDENFPKNKGRRTMMPYVHWGNACEVNGEEVVFQLLIMPIVSPRVYTLHRYPDMNGFPFESYWYSDENLYCYDSIPEDFKDELKDAVHLKRNTGCWRIEPLPSEYIKTKKDFEKTLVTYYVDTHPGGTIGKIAWIVNKAQSKALPDLANNVKFISSKWEYFLKKFYGQERVTAYRCFRREYLDTMNSRYPGLPQ